MTRHELYTQLLNAENLIREHFEGKVDKGGNPYIDHLYRVAKAVNKEKTQIKSYRYKFYAKAYIVALLHDIVEDTNITLDDLNSKGFDSKIITAIDAITRRNDEKYSEFIIRISKNELARIVKIHDLEDNMDIRRLPSYHKEDGERIRKYWYSWHYLKGDISETKYLKEL